MTQPNYLNVCALLLGAAMTALSGAPSASHAQGGDTLYGVTAGNRLVTFNSNSPCTIAWSAPISGLQPRESLLGIDFRPANKKLYGLGSSSRLYVIDTTTGKASVVGSQPFSVALSGSEFGFDFNPTVDRIRVVSNSGQNLRLHPDTGAVAATDKALNYKDAPQVKANVTGAAYSNPDTDPNTGTALYDLDAAFDLLTTQTPPNDGVLNITGELRMGVTGLTGFDISSANVAYAALLRSVPGTDADVDLDARTGGAVANPSDCGASRLVTLDIKTGAATDRGAIGTVSPLRALAVALR